MKGKTRTLAQRTQVAMLALPDAILLETIVQWLDLADEHLDYLEWVDEYRYALGYRLQSDETNMIYTTFEELNKAEPEGACTSWMVPTAPELRDTLSGFSAEQFYHTVISLAGEALSVDGISQSWGFPPSLASDGYDFMRCLAVYLRYKGGPRLEDGHFLFVEEAARRRKSTRPQGTSPSSFVTRWK